MVWVRNYLFNIYYFIMIYDTSADLPDLLYLNQVYLFRIILTVI